MTDTTTKDDADNSPRCEVCGLRVQPGIPCSHCLMKLAEAGGPPDDGLLFEALRWQGFGDYEVIQEIARGGMGVVYRARQLSLGREVALKMILAGELAGKKALRMFQTEAQAAANLHHPNIVPVYEIGEHEMQHYFTMRFVPGGQTIADWAMTQRDHPRAIAAAVAKVARAVAHAHERGVLHRDLKPSNILWDPAGEPMVTDFGLAKLLDDPASTKTRTGEIVGSPCYMAPEQIDGKAGGITTVTDVYGIGAVLYEMLSGKPPFNGASAIETIRRVAQESPRPLPDLPKDLRIICLKCLAKRPEDRYSTVAALADDLERFVRGEPVSAVPLTLPQTLWRWALRKPRQAALFALFVLSTVFGMTGIVVQWRAAERANAAQALALAHLNWQEVGRWLQEGGTSRALAYLAALIRENPDNWQAVMYAMSIVDQNSLAIMAGPPLVPPSRSTCAAALAPDASWVATAGQDKTLRFWTVETGRETLHFEQPATVLALASSTGPLSLAWSLADGSLIALPSLAAEPIRLARTRAEPIVELRFLADGTVLVARSKSALEVWSAATPNAAPPSFTLRGDIQGFDLSSKGQSLMAWSAKQAVVWDLASQAERLHLLPQVSFRKGTLSARGNRLSMIDGEFVAKSWDIDSGREISAIHIKLNSLSHAVLDDQGAHLTLAGFSNELHVYDVASGLPVSDVMQHNYEVKRLVTNANGTHTFSYGWDDTVNCWDAATGQRRMGGIWLGGVRTQLDLSPSLDGSTVLTHGWEASTAEESIKVWRGTRTGQPLRHAVEGQRNLDPCRLSPDGRLGCLGLDPSNRCYLYELSTGKVVLDKQANGDVYVCLFSPDMRLCYALTANGWLHGWSLETGEELWPPNQQSGKIRPAFITPDGSRIVAGHNDGHIRIYDTATGKVEQVLEHPGEIKSLRWAPDNSGRFLSTSTNKIAHTWDIHTGQKLQTFTGHQHTIIASAWSPDALLIATASYDATVRVWSAATGQPIGVPMEHLAWLSHVEFSPNGKRLATACRDGTVRLWHPLTGQPVSQLMQQGTTCETVRFTADGAAILVRDHSGFRFWDVDHAEPTTIHYSEPVTGGLGMDSESYRAIMNGDGTRVFLGSSMNDGAYWSVDQPRGSAPAWFADFIETLAAMRQAGPDHSSRIPAGQLLRLRKLIESTRDNGIHGQWARRVIGM